jgi:type II secretory pathway predicted ATPase ExeA
MVRDTRSTGAAPFSGSPDPAAFFAGPPQEEALARLEWLAAEGQRCGLVVGPTGSGKSHLAVMAGRRLAGLGAEVAVLSLRGLHAADWLEMLLERLPLDPASRLEPLRPWLKLENRLRENTLLERTTALVFDDIDAAPAEVVDGITRLATAAEPRFARTLVVATTTSEGLGRLPEPLRRRAVVRIELAAWTAQETAAYLAHEMARSGGTTGSFTPDAAATLARCAAGVPRDIVALARLALAAATGDGAGAIDAGTVERAWRELSTSWERSPPRDAPAESAAQPAPQVRVVRRLWG